LRVAPEIGSPSASHWKRKLRLVALHFPTVVVSRLPTWAVPETTGATVLRSWVSLTWMNPEGHSELVSEMVRVS
jgi:hypothetical protein